jgi:hypothetical protein
MPPRNNIFDNSRCVQYTEPAMDCTSWAQPEVSRICLWRHADSGIYCTWDYGKTNKTCNFPGIEYGQKCPYKHITDEPMHVVPRHPKDKMVEQAEREKIKQREEQAEREKITQREEKAEWEKIKQREEQAEREKITQREEQAEGEKNVASFTWIEETGNRNPDNYGVYVWGIYAPALAILMRTAVPLLHDLDPKDTCMTTICAFAGNGLDPWIADTFGRLSDNDLVVAFDSRGLLPQSAKIDSDLIFEQMPESTVLYEDIRIRQGSSNSDLYEIVEIVKNNEIQPTVPTTRLRVIVIAWPEPRKTGDDDSWHGQPSFYTQLLGKKLDCDVMVLICSETQATYFDYPIMVQKLAEKGWKLMTNILLPDHRDMPQVACIYAPKSKRFSMPDIETIVSHTNWEQIYTPNESDIQLVRDRFDVEFNVVTDQPHAFN